MAKGPTRITTFQLTLLLVTLVGSTAILYASAVSIQEAGQNAWLSMLVPASLYGLLVVWVTTKLPLRFPGLTFGQYTEKLLGTWLSRLVSLLYLCYILILLVGITREFGNFLSAAFMPETPLVVFNLTLVLLAAFAVAGGIEVIVRMNEFLLPILLLTVFFTFFVLLKEIDLSRLLPVLDEGIWSVFQAGAIPSVFRGEVFVLMWLVYYLERPQESTKGGAWAVLILALFLALNTAVILAVMGKELAARQVFPSLLVARYASVGTFINRTEGLVMVVWVAGGVVKFSALFLIAVENARELLNVSGNRWPLIIPLGAIPTLGGLYAFQNDFQLIMFIRNILPSLSLVFQLLLPSLLLGIAWLKRRGGKSYG